MKKSIKPIKIIILIVLVILVLTLFYLNIKPFGGSVRYSKIINQENTLLPQDRISEIKTEGNIKYQEALADLIYTDISTPGDINEDILLKIRFKDNFPKDSKISVGIQDKENHYNQQTAYIKVPNEKVISSDSINQIPENSIVYIDDINLIVNNQNIISGEIKPLDLQPFLRGSYNILIYLDGDLSFTVKQQDLNWYNNTDETNITLKDSKDNILTSVTIEDDNDNKNDRKLHDPRQATLTYPNLQGIYKIEIRNNEDSIITEIQSSTDKIIFLNKLFLAASKNYVNNDDQFSQVYFNIIKDTNISLSTPHKQYEQNIQINNISYKVPYQQKNTITLPQGSYNLLSFNSNIIVEGNTYFAFNKDSLFNPYKFTITKNIAEADYIITNYIPPIEDNGWLISTVKFNLSDLYIKDNKLNVLINIPHLAKNETKNYTIPIDYIELEYYKKPLFSR